MEHCFAININLYLKSHAPITKGSEDVYIKNESKYFFLSTKTKEYFKI